MPESIVVGLDIGGTSTRAAVFSLSGERLGTGRAGGGNPTSHGAEQAAAQLRAALDAALVGVAPERARAGVIGLAGLGRLLADPAGRAAFDAAWLAAGLRCPYEIHGDALIAYASGSADPAGTVLIAGTGAIAAQVRDLTLDRISDGHGWLLGDVGSGFWLGRAAVRRALADLDCQRELAPVSVRVLTELLGSAKVEPRHRDTVDRLVQTVTRRPPLELAALAPLVVAAYADGDEAAREILTEAAGHLAGSVARIRPAGDTSPVVLGGGLLTGDTPLAGAVRTALARRWPDAPLRTAGDGAAAAAWLAARSLPEVTDPAVLHDRLLATSSI
ncbi:BadF/BadG/BcrA/BcrD ATPase family protein [Micromonospora sp. NPDC049559]|uniref:N-acetylglucosamine kinase n=1 Tax=Micromonospora sp. NPDC049559 TaxID=3155923 RepID=UPI00343A887F